MPVAANWLSVPQQLGGLYAYAIMGAEGNTDYSMRLIAVKSGDRVILRKPHPCGGREWTVTRTGADIGLQCMTCGRRVMLDREEFERRARSIHGAQQPAGGETVC